MNAQPTAADEPQQGRPVTVAEVKALLEAEQSSRGEDLTYEQNLALTHATVFARYSPEKAAALEEELRAIPRLNDWQRRKIVDVAPGHPDDVRAIFAKDRMNLENEDIDRIINAVKASLK
ncbi:MAG TPA: hypothetical protein VI997_12265 [Candidatus Thermoplasmatota archaeon]|nr:hypothetical protein [Candidatus Thermoplasmatota archaeon]